MFILVSSYESPQLGRDQLIELLGRWSLPTLEGAWFGSLELFAPALVLSAAWLLWARPRDGVAGSLTLPILFWAIEAHRLLWGTANGAPSHPIFVIDALASAVVALVATATMWVGMTIGANSYPMASALALPRRGALASGFGSPGVAVVVVCTIVLDWIFVLMCITPIS